MIISLLFETFIKAFLLLILLYIVARDEADFDFRKVTMVTAAIVLGAVILDAVLTRFIGVFTLIPIAAFIVFMIMQFCWVRFWRSLLVAIPFLVLNIMISTAVTGFQQKADAVLSRGLQGPVSDEDMKIALSFYQDGGRTNDLLLRMQKKEAPRMDPNLQDIILKGLVAAIKSKKLPFKLGDTKTIPSLPNIPNESRPAVDAGTSEPAKETVDLTATAPEWGEAGKKITVKGTLIGDDGVRVAMVNNQMVREGECVQVEHKKTIYRWRAMFIRDKGISWEPVEAVKK